MTLPVQMIESMKWTRQPMDDQKMYMIKPPCHAKGECQHKSRTLEAGVCSQFQVHLSGTMETTKPRKAKSE
jgi:hypothetical protein